MEDKFLESIFVETLSNKLEAKLKPISTRNFRKLFRRRYFDWVEHTTDLVFDQICLGKNVNGE